MNQNDLLIWFIRIQILNHRFQCFKKNDEIMFKSFDTFGLFKLFGLMNDKCLIWIISFNEHLDKFNPFVHSINHIWISM